MGSPIQSYHFILVFQELLISDRISNRLEVLGLDPGLVRDFKGVHNTVEADMDRISL